MQIRLVDMLKVMRNKDAHIIIRDGGKEVLSGTKNDVTLGLAERNIYSLDIGENGEFVFALAVDPNNAKRK
jgi:hypothetical protein